MTTDDQSGAPAPATLRCDCCKVLRSRVQHMRPDALGDIFAICDLCMRSVHDAHAAAKHEEPVR